MTRKLLILAIGVALLTLTALAFNKHARTNAATAQTQTPEVPDAIVYKHLFRHVAAFKTKADDLERDNKDARHLRHFFKHKANLNDYQAQMLEQTAVQCALEMKLIDERAKPLIQIYKAQFPNGRRLRGQVPQMPPAELKELSKKRDAVVLRYRDRLRASFGETAFSRFHDFVKHKIAPEVQLQTPNQ